MKRLIALFLFLMPFLSIYAQEGAIKGQVIDKQSRETLIGTTVMLEGTTIGTSTQLDGTFKFSVPNGSHKVIISFVGYVEQKIEVTINGDTKDLGVIELESNAIGLNEVMITASFAKDRQTPVSFSKVDPMKIEEKLGPKEFPEILRSTPSVYATKSGGGFGDSRVNLRGFSSNNLGILVNGFPVNDMENGWVYWSNWAGLADVTHAVQVQRGLGASKLAISSVGGTMNVITKTTEVQKGGTAFYGIGNNNYNKTAFSVSTGLLDNGWALTILGAHTKGDGYIRGTEFEGWSYFLNVSKRIDRKQQIAFTIFGAPQWHNQRSNKHLIEDYRNNADGIQFNSDYGILNGKTYSTKVNEYHKPQMSINHSIQIDSKTLLATSIYASFGRGSGTNIRGTGSKMLTFDLNNGNIPYSETLLTPDGKLDIEGVMAVNKASTTGALAAQIKDINNHNWFGILSTLNTQIGKINFTAGIDGRYYKGIHKSEIVDLLGAKYYIDNNNKNLAQNTPQVVGDQGIYRDYTGEVTWGGLFAQGEYVSDKYTAFVSAAVSNTKYKKYDYFYYTPAQGQESEPVNYLGYSIKGGFNYNLTKNHNLLINAGYFTKAPVFSNAFYYNTIVVNSGAKKERILSIEGGYGFRSNFLTLDATYYYTVWYDKGISRTSGNTVTNILGINAIHQGIELYASAKPTKKLDINLVVSLGNWKWDKNTVADYYDYNTNAYIKTDSVYVKGLKVGDAAQTTANLSINYEILPKLRIGIDYNYTADYYAYFSPENRTSNKEIGIEPWKAPAASIIDLNFNYKFKIGNFNATLSANVDNIFDVEYIADADDGTYHDAKTARVFYGFGRTWTMGLKVHF